MYIPLNHEESTCLVNFLYSALDTLIVLSPFIIMNIRRRIKDSKVAKAKAENFLKFQNRNKVHFK